MTTSAFAQTELSGRIQIMIVPVAVTVIDWIRSPGSPLSPCETTVGGKVIDPDVAAVGFQDCDADPLAASRAI